MKAKTFKYQLHDFWERPLSRPWKFDHQLRRGETFEFDGVTYLVVKKNNEKGWAVVRMVRYKIPNTSSQFVHKCPAKKGHSESLSKDDIVQLQEKHGQKRAADIMNERVKIRAVGAQLEFKCPFCETLFWREHFELPPPVFVDRIMRTRRLRKRVEA